MANLLKEDVAEGQRQLMALASAAASPASADGPRALTMQELEARDPTVEITALLQQKRCAAMSSGKHIFCASESLVSEVFLASPVNLFCRSWTVMIGAAASLIALRRIVMLCLPCTDMRRPSAWP